jgi:hypothetical protein
MATTKSNPITVIGLLVGIAAIVGGALYYQKVNFIPVAGKIISSEVKCYDTRVDKNNKAREDFTPFYERPCPGKGLYVSFGNSNKRLSRVHFFTYQYRSPADNKEYTNKTYRVIDIRTDENNLPTDIMVLAHKSIPDRSVVDKIIPKSE